MILPGVGSSRSSNPPPLLFSPENLPDKAERDQYELLCLDNTRKSVDDFKECSLAQVPSHAVVARSENGKEDLIWRLLNKAQVSTLLLGFDARGSFLP